MPGINEVCNAPALLHYMVFWCFCFFLQSSLWCWEWKVTEEKLRGYARPPKLVFLILSCASEWGYAVFWDQRQECSDLTLVQVAWDVSRATGERFFFLWAPLVFWLFSCFCTFQSSVWCGEGVARKEKLWSYAGPPTFLRVTVRWNGDMVIFAMTRIRDLSSNWCRWR